MILNISERPLGLIQLMLTVLVFWFLVLLVPPLPAFSDCAPELAFASWPLAHLLGSAAHSLPNNGAKTWKAANGGAKRIVRFWGGKTYHRVSPPKPVLEASESGICLVCACFL